MDLLQVEGLSKDYPGFRLQDITFNLEAGYILGFIGINGAGKTTTLKSILNMVHPDNGEVRILGMDMRREETRIKQDIAVVLGDKDLYKSIRGDRITRAVRPFYSRWDEKAYQQYIRSYRIDETKKLGELSEGMKTKYMLALALSHQAKLIILDEPTSALDPAARDELLETFQELVESGEKSILYSTHITSDLEKCADYILYLDDGKKIGYDDKISFLDTYRLVHGGLSDWRDGFADACISFKKHSHGFSALLYTSELSKFSGVKAERATMEDIMVYHARRRNDVSKTVA